MGDLMKSMKRMTVTVRWRALPPLPPLPTRVVVLLLTDFSGRQRGGALRRTGPTKDWHDRQDGALQSAAKGRTLEAAAN